MKTIKTAGILSLLLLFAQCKSTAPTSPPVGSASVLQVKQILDTTQSKFYQYADSTNGDPRKALMLTASWLQAQTNVKSVATIDSSYITITSQSGLISTYYFIEVDSSGKSIFRGGGQGDRDSGPYLQQFVPLGSPATNTIKNTKVLLYMPAYGEFYAGSDELQKVQDVLTNSGLGLDVTVLEGSEATYQTVDNFASYGLVIIDTHGMPERFMTGSTALFSDAPQTEDQLKTILNATLGADTYSLIQSDDLELARGLTITDYLAGWQKNKGNTQQLQLHVTAKHISTIPSLANTVVFGNMCYSGWNFVGSKGSVYDVKNPIRAAFMSRNPISYYCYTYQAPNTDFSRTVTDKFSHHMEDSVVTALVSNLDSTGHAYLAYDNTQFFDPYLGIPNKFGLNHFGADDYSYVKCGDPFVDPRDGQVYPTVCIGSQVWMAKNLNFDTAGSVCYDYQSGNCDTYGRLYDFNTMTAGGHSSIANPSGVQGICPKGWHVPSDEEYEILSGFLGTSAGGALKSTSTLWAGANTGATNSSGFSALPGGYTIDTSWSGLGQSALFGTATVSVGVNGGWSLWGLNANSAGFGGNQGDPSLNWYASCRCVKDP